MSRHRNDCRGRILLSFLLGFALLGLGSAPAEAAPPGPGQRPAVGDRGASNVRWVVLKLGGGTRALLEQQRQPYPVFLLERWQGTGWVVQPADEFRRGQGQVAISITQPGTYRVVAGASPYQLYESPAVTVGANDKTSMVSLDTVEPSAPCEVRVISSSTGKGIGGLSIALVGPYSSLPPVRGVTGADGRISLGQVRARELHLEIEHAGDEPFAQEISRECRSSGRAELRLPR